MPVIEKQGMRNADTYPKDKGEAQKLRDNIIKSMGLPNVQKSIAQAFDMAPEMGVKFIAQTCAMVIAQAIREVKRKFGGKTNIKAVEMCIKLAIRQVGLISKGLGKGEMPRQIVAALAQMIGQMIDGQLKGKPQEQPMMEGQPQQAIPQQGQQMGPQAQPPQQPQGLLGE